MAGSWLEKVLSISISNEELMMFLIAFCIGLIGVALIEPAPELVIRWPTPQNAGLVTYLDRASNCYEYQAKKVKCTTDAMSIPVQNGTSPMETTKPKTLKSLQENFVIHLPNSSLYESSSSSTTETHKELIPSQ
jgi:hypothetical protein